MNVISTELKARWCVFHSHDDADVDIVKVAVQFLEMPCNCNWWRNGFNFAIIVSRRRHFKTILI